MGIEVFFITTVIFLENILQAAKLEASKNGNNRFNKKSSKKESDIEFELLFVEEEKAYTPNSTSRKEGRRHGGC